MSFSEKIIKSKSTCRKKKKRNKIKIRDDDGPFRVRPVRYNDLVESDEDSKYEASNALDNVIEANGFKGAHGNEK